MKKHAITQGVAATWGSDGTRDRPVVLVIEDDADAWRIYGQILWYNGFDVIHAATGQGGYRAARSFRPDMILLDLGLPDIDGLTLCQKLRAEGNTVPVAALTAQTRMDMGGRADAAGFTLYLEKPCDPVRVLHTVEGMIGRAPPAGEGRPPSKSVAE